MADDGVRVPKLVRQVAEAPGAANLGVADGLVLARIDGKMNDRELAAACGLTEDDVRVALLRLYALGLVTLESPSAAPGTAPAAAAPSTPALYDPAALDEDVDLDVEQRRRVLEHFYRMKELDHYGLLGIPRTADKKGVKRAYFELTAHFHPDKFFRKRLGTFKLKMEAIFSQLTKAHDVLTDKEQRAEYDGYLGDIERARGIETMLKDVFAEVARAEELARSAVPGDGAPVELAPLGVGAAPAAIEAIAPRAPVPLHSRRAGTIPPPDAKARREVLARRLLGGRAPPPRGSSPDLGRSAGGQAQGHQRPHRTTEDAVEALRRRYEERVSQARKFQAKKYADNGAGAMAQKDPVAAANAYRVAITLAPEDAELARAHAVAQAAADAVLSESYERQATYEEKSQKWDDAARSWARVAKARPTDASAHERAAHAIVKAEGNLHEGAALGRRAVELEPANAQFKVTLALVYLAAGLQLNAKRELDAAAQLSPHDGTIQTLLKRVTKSS